MAINPVFKWLLAKLFTGDIADLQLVGLKLASKVQVILCPSSTMYEATGRGEEKEGCSTMYGVHGRGEE